MSKITKIFLLLFVLNGFMLNTWADGGSGKKKAKVTLNLANPKTSPTSSFILKAGIKYKGSLLNASEKNKGSIINSNSLSFQKGNTIHIIPYKQKVIVPEMKQGYTGLKLILQPKL